MPTAAARERYGRSARPTGAENAVWPARPVSPAAREALLHLVEAAAEVGPDTPLAEEGLPDIASLTMNDDTAMHDDALQHPAAASSSSVAPAVATHGTAAPHTDPRQANLPPQTMLGTDS